MNAKRAIVFWAFALVAAWARADYPVNYGKVDTSRWRCLLCPFDSGAAQRGALAAGALHSARGEARFGRDNGVDRAGAFGRVNADYRVATGRGALFNAQARNLGLREWAIGADYRQTGRFAVRAAYRQLPRNVAADGRSPFRAGETLTLPPTWVRAFSTGGMETLAASARPIDLATVRRRSDVALRYSLTTKATLTAAYFDERKTGAALGHRDALYQATALPLPIDHRATGWEAGWRHEGANGLVGINYRRSRLANDQTAWTWQNPFLGGPPLLRSATPPSNSATSLRLVGRARLGRRTTLSVNAGRGLAWQRTPFLAYSTNANIALPPVAGIAGDHLDGARESRHGALTVTTRLTSRLAINLKHSRRDRRDTRAPRLLTPVLGDLFVAGEHVAHGYAFGRSHTEVSARYRAPKRLRLAVGGARTTRTRSPAEIARNDEQRLWLDASRQFGASWRASARVERRRRDAAPFQPHGTNNPLTRRHHQAARNETTWQAGVRYTSPTSGFSAGANATREAVRYPHSALGLGSEDASGWHLDVAYAAEKVAAQAFFDSRTRRSTTAGSELFGSRPWRYDIGDRVVTSGARLQVTGLWHPAIDFTLHYARSHGAGAYSTALPDRRTAFPTLLSRHRAVDARLRYSFATNFAVSAQLYVERYAGADWAIDGIAQDSLRNVLALGHSSPRYHNRLLGLVVERRL